MSDLFDVKSMSQPLAERMRPESLDNYVGQQHILAEDKPLYSAIKQDTLHSMLLWGPPGVGKTSLARLIANETESEFISVSAIMGGIKDIRVAVERSKQLAYSGRKTILFVDEVHRFNKAQQDAFLPFVEDGTFLFIGATTENPSFELNNALLSRCRVYRLTALGDQDLRQLVNSALTAEKGLGRQNLSIDQSALDILVKSSGGDSRRLLNCLEIASDSIEKGSNVITETHVIEVVGDPIRQFDKGGDLFYEQISALHKSVRGSDPDAAIYWFCRMIDGGCDPLYIARRVVRMASEDIGNADPRGLQIALNAWDCQHRLGSPEGELAIAQAVIYLASAAKSNAVYNAYKQTMAFVQQDTTHEVPIHLRNAPTQLMKDMDYGTEYRYSHDEPQAFSAGQSYWPDDVAAQYFYQPVERGLEIQIKQKLQYLRQLNKDHKK
ncbi:MAG: replication-associated recombination protein A [Kangiellaceae bacterium]|jgi:putative ATPase|nr:replication-associated recombination protein A [Kangiellaceae bacterium]